MQQWASTEEKIKTFFLEDLVMFPSLKIAKTCKGYKDWLAWEDMEMEGRAKDAPKAERKL